MIGNIINGITGVASKVTDTIKHKNELKFKAEEMRFDYLKANMTIALFATIVICVISPLLAYFMSPLLKYIPGMEGILNDYQIILNTVGFSNLWDVVKFLLGMGVAGSGGLAVGKVIMASKQANIKKELIKEKQKPKTEDDYVKLELNDKAKPSLRVKRFFKKYHKYAIETEKKYGLPANAVLAHAALETLWGEKITKGTDIETGKTIRTNSIFNIKDSKSWKGKKVLKEDAWEDYNKNGKPDEGEYEDGIFRAYDSPRDSFDDYGKLITTSNRYEDADLAEDPHEYAKAVNKCGFQTDGKAADKMISIMKKYFIYET
jgi:flagellum-specific peptidoglycan hydrolase FlgJ